MKPLEGIKILEMTHVISAPFCGQLLGDLGADIIKIEKSDGEFSRYVPPFTPEGKGIWFPNYNRNKRGIKLNLRNSKSIQIIKDLAKETDVFIENMRPGLINQLGLGYTDLKTINPRLIMLSISGYGQTGPYSKMTAFDMTIEAMNGIMSLTGDPDGPPMKMGTAITDFTAGYCGAIGVLAALRARDISGEGQYVDVSMLEASLPLIETALAEYTIFGRLPPRVGNSRAAGGPSNVFKAKDSYIYLSASGKNLFRRFCILVGREDLVDDPRFSNSVNRKKNEPILEQIAQEWVSHFTADEAIKCLEESGLPSARVNTVKEVLKDPQLKERNAIVLETDPELGEYPYISFPVHFSDFETRLFRKAPQLGQHTREVLCGDLGYSPEKYESLLQDGVI